MYVPSIMSCYALHATIFNPSQDFIHENVAYNWPWLKTDYGKKNPIFSSVCLYVLLIVMEIGNFHLNFKIMAFPNALNLTLFMGQKYMSLCKQPILFASRTCDMNFCMITRVVCLTLTVIHTT
jgi:hypothetical protein